MPNSKFLRMKNGLMHFNAKRLDHIAPENRATELLRYCRDRMRELSELGIDEEACHVIDVFLKESK
jgi:hypothetical protein